MTYARFEVDKDRFNALEKSVPIQVVSKYGHETWVYAPKSRMIVEAERTMPMTNNQVMVQILIPYWVFKKNSCFPSDGTGYIESVERN